MANDRNAGRKRKLTPLEENDISMLHEFNVPMHEIVSKYKISESTIRRIHKRVMSQGISFYALESK